MSGWRWSLMVGILMTLLVAGRGAAQSAVGDAGQQQDSCKIAADGTAYVTRVVPVPTTISAEAQRMLAHAQSDAAVPQTLEQRRTHTDTWQAGAGEASKKIYPVNVAADTIAGVPVRVVTPLNVTPEKRDR